MSYLFSHRLPLTIAVITALCQLPALAQNSTADDSESEANTVFELAPVVARSSIFTQPNTQKISREEIDTQLIENSRDLVRYTPDVGIADNGRHNKGFAMRGVEGNRVGISIDGVPLPDSEENSLYKRYGNFNNSRLSIDPELVHGIDIVKGGNAFDQGSGSLGGGVNYRTLEPADLIEPDKTTGALIKGAYASRNNEWVKTVGAAGKSDSAEAILLYSHRQGHELESSVKGADDIGWKRGAVDPSSHKFHSLLGKIKWHFSPEQSAGIGFNGQKGNNYTDEKSYSSSWGWREADDISQRQNVNAFYEFTPQSNWLSRLKLDLDYQKTELGSINYKGSYNWFTNAKELDEIYDRRMETEFKRAAVTMDTLAFELGGSHQLRAKAFISESAFSSLSNDDYYWKGTISRQTNTIQNPVKTLHWGTSIQDEIVWNNGISATAGLRYDFYHLKPQELNANCNACSKEILDANRFGGVSALAGINYQIDDNWQLGYNFTTGFRVPTASEMYFTFNSSAGKWAANPNLRPEHSYNHSLNLQGRGQLGELDATLYHNRYTGFLHEHQSLVTETEDYCLPYGYSCPTTRTVPIWQMVNIDKASITGIELSGRLNLSALTPAIPEGFSAMGAYGYSKAHLAGDESLLSIQPQKLVLGLDYESPEKNWGVFNRMTYYGAKKAKDAMTVEYVGWNYDREVKPYPYRNGSAVVFDTFGYYKPVKNLTIRAGVYNLFNRKYQTWDALRGINQYSTTSAVNPNNPSEGLKRYYAPGRNYMISFEARL